MAIENLDPVALKAWLMTHAILNSLESKGILTTQEARELVRKVDFALEIVEVDKSAQLKSAESILNLLVDHTSRRHMLGGA